MKNILTSFLILSFWAMVQAPVLAQSCNPDVDAPTPFCTNRMQVTPDPSGTTTIFASDIDAGSNDNCTAREDLVFTFDEAGQMLSEDFVGEGEFTRDMWVTDEAGNKSFCTMLIVLRCPVDLACNDLVPVEADPGTTVEVHWRDVVEGTYCSDFVISFSPTDPNDSTITFDGSSQFPVPYTVYEINSGNTCWGSLVNCRTTAPVAICNSFLNVSLDAYGKAEVGVNLFDQGSYSPCSAVDLFVRRGNDDPGKCESPTNDWRQSIVFCCSDVGDTVIVELLVRDADGKETICFTEVLVEDKLGITKDCSAIEGYIYKDDNTNCTADVGEDSLEQVLVIATDGVDEYVGFSDPNGYYKIFAPFGDYTVYAQSPGAYWDVCPTTVNVTLDDNNKIATQNFGLDEINECPLLNVNISLQRLRRCFENKGFIRYINTGTITAKDASIDLTLDAGLDLIAASAPYTNNGGNNYTFEVGDVAPFEAKNIDITVVPNCDSTSLGQTKCIEAVILPDTFCGELLQWSGANIILDAECIGDSVKFTLTNNGTADMVSSRDYHVIEDDVIMFMEKFILGESKETSITRLADGRTLRLVAQQEEGHPYPYAQTIAVEGCDDQGNFNPDFMRMFPPGAQEPNKDIACLEIIGSYDPNEKAASPEGYGIENYLEPGNPITYTLYFQNTGTDTAFNVYILDTISDHLDMKTFQTGASSHNVDVIFLEDRAIRFDFKNIMLPDSFVNEPASNGFVEFTITPKEDLPLPTWITNSVGIYFDFNDPIITNTVHHTIDTGFLKISTSVDWFNQDLEEVEVYPVPTTDVVHWEWTSDMNVRGEIVITDLLGKTVQKQNVNGNKVSMHLGTLDHGHYIYHIRDRGALFASGKILVGRK